MQTLREHGNSIQPQIVLLGIRTQDLVYCNVTVQTTKSACDAKLCEMFYYLIFAFLASVTASFITVY